MQIPESIRWGKIQFHILSDTDCLPIWKEKESNFLKSIVKILNHPVGVHVIIHGHILFKKEEASPVSSPTTQTEL